MKIGVNLLYLIPGFNGGTETYAAGLLEGFSGLGGDEEFFVFVSQEAASWPLPTHPRFRRVLCPVSANSRPRRYWYEQTVLPDLLKGQGVDLVHSLGYVGPLYPPCSSVLTIPDLNYKNFGDSMSNLRRWALAFFVRQAATRSQKIIAISEFACREIQHEFGFPASKMSVTYLAPRLRSEDNHDGAAPTGLDPAIPLILAFSNVSPNKNIPRLIEAFQQARQRYDLPHRLVLIGHRPAALPPSAEVHCPGYVDDAVVSQFFRQATMLVVPSTYEGFGLPVLEAMQHGIPVVCSRATSLPEVAGNAALYFDPYSVDEISSQIARVAGDLELQAELRDKGFRNLRRFSWETTARQTLAVYNEALAAAG